MHPDAVVVIDEAYIDYADDVKQASAVRLIRQFDNLVITQTFFKISCLGRFACGHGICQSKFNCRIDGNEK